MSNLFSTNRKRASEGQLETDTRETQRLIKELIDDWGIGDQPTLYTVRISKFITMTEFFTVVKGNCGRGHFNCCIKEFDRLISRTSCAENKLGGIWYPSHSEWRFGRDKFYMVNAILQRLDEEFPENFDTHIGPAGCFTEPPRRKRMLDEKTQTSLFYHSSDDTRDQDEEQFALAKDRTVFYRRVARISEQGKVYKN